MGGRPSHNSLMFGSAPLLKRNSITFVRPSWQQRNNVVVSSDQRAFTSEPAVFTKYLTTFKKSKVCFQILVPVTLSVRLSLHANVRVLRPFAVGSSLRILRPPLGTFYTGRAICAEHPNPRPLHIPGRNLVAHWSGLCLNLTRKK